MYSSIRLYWYQIWYVDFKNWFIYLSLHRLSGISPFMGETDQETLKNVSGGEWDFDEDAFADISDEGLDWIEKILIKNKE